MEATRDVNHMRLNPVSTMSMGQGCHAQKDQRPPNAIVVVTTQATMCPMKRIRPTARRATPSSATSRRSRSS